LRVVVLEKGEIAGEQSSRNWGFLRQQGRSPAELPLIKRSIEIWDDIQRESGEDLGYRRTGTLYVSDQKDAPEAWQVWMDTCRDLNIGVSMLTAAQTQEALPSTIKWTHGIQTPSDGFAEPARAVPFIARSATARGVTIMQGCAARVLETAGGGGRGRPYGKRLRENGCRALRCGRMDQPIPSPTRNSPSPTGGKGIGSANRTDERNLAFWRRRVPRIHGAPAR
jgi:glycine/D-amino acid oxidase-like deaminating enzyme